MSDDRLTIGEVAAAAGLKTSAIRFYEERGVLPEPVRVGGQRRYTEQTVERLAELEVAKRAGFTLDEARLLFEATDSGAPAHAELRSFAQRKLPEVEALIARTQAMKAWLEVASGCGCDTLDSCGLFSTDSPSLTCDA